MNMFRNDILTMLELNYGKNIRDASKSELYSAVSNAAMKNIKVKWKAPDIGKKACYFSSEFLIGRLIYSNLLNLGLINQLYELFNENNIDVDIFENIEDAALGSGGLGRLAACLLDSAATQYIVLNGYGIRYKYGFFKQHFENGFQKETVDDWQLLGDPWASRIESEKVKIKFKNQTIYAVPYDTPIIGYGAKTINTLRLWQAEPLNKFDFQLFYNQKFEMAVRENNNAEAISSILYPNDTSDKGKRLCLKQQYFLSSASLQDIIKTYSKRYGNDFSHFSKEYAIQLNDTYPVVSIPEFIRLLVENKGVSFNKALKIARKIFAYTNHATMVENFEKWDVKLFKSVIPNVYRYIVMINRALQRELTAMGIIGDVQKKYMIIEDTTTIHMVNLAIFATHSTNGVAQIQTERLEEKAFRKWYEIYPKRFSNKTNGITQRRWLVLSNMELSKLITEKIGSTAWVTNLDKLKTLEKYKDDRTVINQFADIKHIKKQQLADYISKYDGIKVNPDFIFDIQVKCMNESKRQLLNVFSILDIYFGLKSGRIKDFNPTVFIFGGKAAPDCFRAKGIIKFINEIADRVNSDPAVSNLLKVVLISNYNVSYAEKIMPAADISEQISTAGTEASGTGNMKFMLNGAVTLGTYEGTNIEIVQQAGYENNYIFGAHVEELEIIADLYNPRKIYEQSPRIKAVVDTLINGMFDDCGAGMFQELYESLLVGVNRCKLDKYYLLYDIKSYCDAKLRANSDYGDSFKFTQKCFMNTVNAGGFSSDRTVNEYASKIWGM